MPHLHYAQTHHIICVSWFGGLERGVAEIILLFDCDVCLRLLAFLQAGNMQTPVNSATPPFIHYRFHRTSNADIIAASGQLADFPPEHRPRPIGYSFHPMGGEDDTILFEDIPALMAREAELAEAMFFIDNAPTPAQEFGDLVELWHELGLR